MLALAALILLSTAQGLVIRGGGCNLQITANCASGGPVGELSSGQVRFGNIDSATFSLSNTDLHDSHGMGCWWTPPTHVLQCDVNQNPSSGFSVSCSGSISYNGQSTFYQCDAGDGQYNIYLDDNQGINCGPVTLSTSDCKPASCNQPPPPPPPPQGCPANLNGAYQFPHLIIPVDKSNPNSAPGTSYFGEVTPDISSIFNFDIPESYSGKKCSLIFLFPEQADLQTSSFTLSGNGMIDFSRLNGPASSSTSYSNMPGVATDYGVTTVSPGNSYTIATFSCPAGQTVAFEMSEGGDTSLKYFQDYNPSPIGLYITSC